MFYCWFAFSNEIPSSEKILKRSWVLVRITFEGEAAGLRCNN